MKAKNYIRPGRFGYHLPAGMLIRQLPLYRPRPNARSPWRPQYETFRNESGGVSPGHTSLSVSPGFPRPARALAWRNMLAVTVAGCDGLCAPDAHRCW